MIVDTVPGKALRAEIEGYLPHRAPFALVDEVEVSEGHIRGAMVFPADSFFFAGHFPGYPVVPGVLLVESMAQCGGAGVKRMGLVPNGTFFLAKVKEARFRRQVRPGVVGLAPPARVQVDALARRLLFAPAGLGQRRAELEHGRLEIRPHAQLQKRRRDAEHEQGPRLLAGQPGQVGAVFFQQGNAAARPALGVDRHARRAQRIDIAVDRALGDFQFGGQRLRRHLAVRLQKHQH